MLSWLWQFVKPYKSQVFLALVALLMTSAVTLSIGEGLKQMVDEGFSENSSQGLIDALVVILVISLVLAIGSFVRFYLVSWIGERAVADIRKQLHQHLLTLQPSFFEDNLAGEIQSRVTTDTTLLETVIGSSVSFALRNIITFIGAVILMFVTNAKLALIVLTMVPCVSVPLVYFGRKVRNYSKVSQEKVANVGAWASESLQHIKVVQAFTREDLVSQRFSASAEMAFDAARKRIFHRAMLIALVVILVFTSIAAMIYVGGTDVINGELTAGELSAFVFYSLMVAGSLGAVIGVFSEILRAAGAIERIRELFLTKPLIQSVELPTPINSQDTFKDNLIEFNHVNFIYPSRPDYLALNDLSFTVKQGEKVALVGPSGAGKSTLFDLLLRFRDANDGEILLAGTPITELDIHDLRDQFALVPQQPVLFSADVWENLRYGSPNATQEQVIAAAKAANAHDFIMELPNGYHAFLGEQGVKLSGGQKQRLAIARAILRDPKILLLDEATSALDAQSEFLVQQALNELMKNRTTFIIAHRLATVAQVDRIFVLDHGRLIDSGSHQGLMASSELYARLAKLQFEAATL
ncbi:hydrophobic compound transporter HcuC [Oceaniserpentilla sp. 4NH20-0058]|uniref:ABC transporter transmembrane domain-containing protein n=1 Tax=Oceaniserpentilla sp. 4NH20-0058 TaxID=3127660 RepID=UPI0031073DBB